MRSGETSFSLDARGNDYVSSCVATGVKGYVQLQRSVDLHFIRNWDIVLLLSLSRLVFALVYSIRAALENSRGYFY